MRDPRWAKTRISSCNNKHENVDNFQYGGTSVMAFNEVAHRVHTTGGDDTGLGCWSWILFEGKSKYRTRIISAYVPCRTSDTHRQTVYMQHKRYFMKRGISECPRKLMQSHLCNQIRNWQNNGENIVLLIDANENLARTGPLQSLLLHDCQLIDPIREIHANPKTSLPATSLTGSVPIDSIFVSPQLRNITRGGWIRIEESIGDHRALFIDIPTHTLLGEEPFTVQRHTARKLICDQPKVVNKCNKLLHRQLKSQHTFQSYATFEQNLQNNKYTDDEAILLLDKIDRSITNSVLYAEKRCRKIKAGAAPYTPALHKAGTTINLWNNVIRKKKGCNISSTYIKRIAKKANIISPMSLSLQDCENERRIASQVYKQLKRNAKHSRDQFIHELAAQQSTRGNESIGNAVRRLARNEELRASHRRIKIVTKPFQGATERVMIRDINNDDNEIVTTDKDTIEEALHHENLEKFSLAYSSPFLKNP